MLKVSITLPGETVITLESSDMQVAREVVAMALKELPADLIRLQMSPQASEAKVNGNGTIDETEASGVSVEPDLNGDGSVEAKPPVSVDADDRERFSKYCSGLAPVGDMRRVVVAMEGAALHLGIDNVSEKELGDLFDMAGWRRASDFRQTLRNAARSKFGWTERVPGSKGYYAVSEAGRKAVAASGQGQRL